MSDFEENIHPATPLEQVDLLVDGELSEDDRRALLLQLEHEPEGWRRCALAFLEAQCWKAALGPIALPTGPEATKAEPLSQAEPKGRRQSWRQHAATMLTISASFLIALVVGMGLRGSWSGGSLHSHDPSLVEKALNEFPLAKTPQVPAATPVADDWETVTLDGAKSPDGQAEPVQVQALRRDTLDQNMLEQVPSVISPDLQQALEQSGYRVVQQREIVPLPMKDNRRLVVPVDHVQIHYVGRSSL